MPPPLNFFDSRYGILGTPATDGRQVGQMSLRLHRQTLSRDIDTWVSDGKGITGRVQIDDETRTPYTRTQTRGDGPPAEGSAAMVTVVYTNCTYLVDASFAVGTTETTVHVNGDDSPTETVQRVQRIGTLTKGFTPIYANAAVLRRLQGERTGSVIQEQAAQPDIVNYAPAHTAGNPTPAGGLNVRWKASPVE